MWPFLKNKFMSLEEPSDPNISVLKPCRSCLIRYKYILMKNVIVYNLRNSCKSMALYWVALVGFFSAVCQISYFKNKPNYVVSLHPENLLLQVPFAGANGQWIILTLTVCFAAGRNLPISNVTSCSFSYYGNTRGQHVQHGHQLLQVVADDYFMHGTGQQVIKVNLQLPLAIMWLGKKLN